MRLISGAVAGILVGAMLVSVVASGIVYAGAASSSELKDKLSSLEDQKAEIKKELDSTANKVSDVEKTRAALQKEITLTKEEIETVKAYIERLQQQIDVKSTELESAQKALEAKEENFSQTVRTTYEQGDISYIEVLLNSSSFSDLLNRLDIVSTIMDDNKKIVAEYTAAKEDIQQKRDDLQKTQDEQVQYQDNLNYKAEELKSSEEQQKALQESLEAYQKEQKAEYERITSEMDTVSDQIAEQSRKEAEAAAKAAAAAKAQKKNSSAAVRSRRPARARYPLQRHVHLAAAGLHERFERIRLAHPIQSSAPASSTRARIFRHRPAQPSLQLLPARLPPQAGFPATATIRSSTTAAAS